MDSPRGNLSAISKTLRRLARCGDVAQLRDYVRGNAFVAFAERLSTDKRVTLPTGYDKDFDICRRFLDQHAGR